MKCIYCGKELAEGELFCPACGKAVQIVPDYNVYDDDYLKEVLAQENQKKPATTDIKKKTASVTSTAQPSGKGANQKQKKKQMMIIGGVIAVICVLVLVLVLVGAGIQKKHANSFDYQVSLAEEAYKKGNMNDTITYYENALSLDKNNIEVRLILAGIYEKQKNDDAALVLYQEVLKIDSANREACKGLIVIYEKQKNYDAIIELSDAVDTSLADLFTDYQVQKPKFSIESGVYDGAQTLMLSSDAGDSVFYTTDGSDPMEKGLMYTNPIPLGENNHTYVIKAVCMNDKNLYSDVVTNQYQIKIPAPDIPIVTPDGGDFGVETTVSVTVPDGCSAYYTWDGSTPTSASSRYAGPLTIPEGNNVLSVIMIDNKTHLSSEVYRGNFIYYAEDYENNEDAEAEDALDE